MRSTLSKLAAQAACVVLLQGPGAFASAPLEGGAEPLTRAEASAIGLLRGLRDPQGPGPEAVAVQIHQLGTSTIGCLLEVLVDKRLPALEGDPGESQILSVPQKAAMLLVLSSHGRAAVLPHWKTVFKETPEAPLSEASSSAALESLGAFGIAADLKQVWKLAGIDDKPVAALSRTLSESLQCAIAGILVGDPRAMQRLEATWSRLPLPWHEEVILAVGRTRDARGEGIYLEMMRGASAHQRLIASQVPRLGPSNDASVNRQLAGALLALLGTDSKEDAQAASLAVAVLEDFSVVEDLIELLADPRTGVPQNAHRSLCVLTGVYLAPNPKIWGHWHREELAWAREHREATVARVRSSDENIARAALREIARHKFERHELAQRVSVALTSEHESVRLLCAGVLAELGSRWGTPDLVMALDDDSPAVCAAAHACLVQIIGGDSGQHAGDWRDCDLPGAGF